MIDPTEAEKGGPFPNLASVPEEQPRPSPEAQRDRLTKGLMADRENARYTGDKLTLASTAVPAAEPPTKSVVRRSSDGVAPYTVPRSPEPEPRLPPAPSALQPVAAVTAPDVPPEAPPAGQPEPVLDPDERISLAKGTPQPAPVDPGQLVGVIYFAETSAELDPEAREVLRDVVLLQKQRGGTLRLVGHAGRRRNAEDPMTGQADSLALSLDRAQSVASAMIDLGVRRKALELTAASDTDPAYDETTPAGQAGNRRVEIFLAN